MLNVRRAKKILGKSAEQYTDEQLSLILKSIKQFTGVCVDDISRKIDKYGPGFLDKSLDKG